MPRAVGGLGDIPAQLRWRDCSHLSVRRARRQFCAITRPSHRPFGSSTAGIDQLDGQSHGRRIAWQVIDAFFWDDAPIHLRPSDRATITLAESLRRAADRRDPMRMPRPYDHRGNTSAPDPAKLCDLFRPDSRDRIGRTWVNTCPPAPISADVIIGTEATQATAREYIVDYSSGRALRRPANQGGGEASVCAGPEGKELVSQGQCEARPAGRVA